MTPRKGKPIPVAKKPKFAKKTEAPASCPICTGKIKFPAPKDLQWLVLAGFSALFFLAVWLFSRKPSKILDYVGKFLNPLFLALLGILIVLAFVKPLGHVASAAVGENYISSPFFKGFTEGYNTLDALASLAFGIVAVSTLRNMGVEKRLT